MNAILEMQSRPHIVSVIGAVYFLTHYKLQDGSHSQGTEVRLSQADTESK